MVQKLRWESRSSSASQSAALRHDGTIRKLCNALRCGLTQLQNGAPSSRSRASTVYFNVRVCVFVFFDSVVSVSRSSSHNCTVMSNFEAALPPRKNRRRSFACTCVRIMLCGALRAWIYFIGSFSTMLKNESCQAFWSIPIRA